MSASDSPRIAAAADLPVRLTRHVLDRARTRHSAFYRAQGDRGIRREVRDALRADRKAKTVPRWAVVKLKRSKIQRGKGTSSLFVWNAEETRCYVIARSRTKLDQPCWVVVTILYPGTGSDDLVAGFAT